MTTPKEPCPELSDYQRAIKADQWPILSAFADALDDFPRGEAIDCDTPDFIVDAGGSLLGVELVALRSASDAAALRADVFRNLLMRAASALFESDIELPISVQLSEKLLARTDEVLMNAAAETLVRRVRANVPQHAGGTRDVPYWQFIGTPLLEVTDALRVTRLAEGARAEWAFVRDGHYTLDADAIQNAINHKNANAEKGRRRCDALWLVVAVGYEHISQTLILADDALARHYQSKFDRAFLFDCYGRGVMPLDTVEPASANRS